MNNNNIIGAEGTNEALQNAFNSFSQSIGTQTQVQENTTQPQTADETSTQKATVTETPTTQNQNEATNKAFAQMRISNNEMSQKLAALEKVLQAQGHASIDAYLAQQQNAEIEKKAQQNGVTPEFEKRIIALEKENQRYRENERRNALSQQVSSLVQKYGITQDQWQVFAQQVASRNINVLDSNVSLESLYLEYNMDSIMAKRIEAEKQKWLSELQRTQNAPVTTPIGNSVNTNNTDKVDLRKVAINFANSKK